MCVLISICHRSSCASDNAPLETAPLHFHRRPWSRLVAYACCTSSSSRTSPLQWCWWPPSGEWGMHLWLAQGGNGSTATGTSLQATPLQRDNDNHPTAWYQWSWDMWAHTMLTSGISPDGNVWVVMVPAGPWVSWWRGLMQLRKLSWALAYWPVWSHWLMPSLTVSWHKVSKSTLQCDIVRNPCTR
jgi:hypothetical protein